VGCWSGDTAGGDHGELNRRQSLPDAVALLASGASRRMDRPRDLDGAPPLDRRARFRGTAPILAGDVLLAAANSVQSFTVDPGPPDTSDPRSPPHRRDGLDDAARNHGDELVGHAGRARFAPQRKHVTPSTSGPGVATYQNSLFNCDPAPALSWGHGHHPGPRGPFRQWGPPATVAVEIRGATRPPTTTPEPTGRYELSPQQPFPPRATRFYMKTTLLPATAPPVLWAERATVLPTTRTDADRSSPST
jgi:hypothetical protein